MHPVATHRLAVPAIVALVWAAGLFLAAAATANAAGGQRLEGPARVVDGDTLDIHGRSGQVRVRIYGIDTPERGEPGHDSATRALRALVAAGPIACRPRPGEETYGRIVATCTVAGRDVALDLLRAGHAAPWCRYLRGDRLERDYLAAGRAAWAAAAFGGRRPPPHKPRHGCG